MSCAPIQLGPQQTERRNHISSELWQQQWESLDPLLSPRTAPYQHLLVLDNKKVSAYGKWMQLCSKWLQGDKSNRDGAIKRKRWFSFSGFPVLKQYFKFTASVSRLATRVSLCVSMLHWFFALFDQKNFQK